MVRDEHGGLDMEAFIANPTQEEISRQLRSFSCTKPKDLICSNCALRRESEPVSQRCTIAWIFNEQDEHGKVVDGVRQLKVSDEILAKLYMLATELLAGIEVKDG